MAKTIALLVNAVTRTLTQVRDDGVTCVFEEKTGPLLGRLRFTSSTKDNAAGTVIRTKFKIERSQLDVIAAGAGVAASTKVRYVEVWSDDITVVKAGESAGRTELYDLKKAFVNSQVCKDMVVDGTPLNA